MPIRSRNATLLNGGRKMSNSRRSVRNDRALKVLFTASFNNQLYAGPPIDQMRLILSSYKEFNSARTEAIHNGDRDKLIEVSKFN